MKVTVCWGYSADEAGRIKDILSQNHIWYTTRIQNHENAFLGGGRGTLRSTFGSAGVSENFRLLYEVLVKSKDADAANAILSGSHMI